MHRGHCEGFTRLSPETEGTCLQASGASFYAYCDCVCGGMFQGFGRVIVILDRDLTYVSTDGSNQTFLRLCDPSECEIHPTILRVVHGLAGQASSKYLPEETACRYWHP